VATSVRSGFSNQGEICLCGSRIFVEEDIYDEFLKAFVDRAQKLVVGDPSDPKTDIGALISQQHMSKVLQYIDIAKEEGGRIEYGGKRLSIQGFEDGYFVEPTVVTK